METRKITITQDISTPQLSAIIGHLAISQALDFEDDPKHYVHLEVEETYAIVPLKLDFVIDDFNCTLLFEALKDCYLKIDDELPTIITVSIEGPFKEAKHGKE